MIRNSTSRCFLAPANNLASSLIKRPCYKFSIFNDRNTQNNRFQRIFQPLCLLLVGANTFLFFSWHYGWISKESLLENFSINKESMDQCYYYTLVTSSLLHENKWHFALNTSALLVFGSKFELFFGAGPLLATYSLASIVAGLSFHWYNNSGEEKYKNRRVGAIAPVSAIITGLALNRSAFCGIPAGVFMGAVILTSVLLSNTQDKEDDDFDYGGVFPGTLIGLGSMAYLLLNLVSRVL